MVESTSRESRHDWSFPDLLADPDERFRPNAALAAILDERIVHPPNNGGRVIGLDRPLIPLLNAVATLGYQTGCSCIGGFLSLKGAGTKENQLARWLMEHIPNTTRCWETDWTATTANSLYTSVSWNRVPEKQIDALVLALSTGVLNTELSTSNRLSPQGEWLMRVQKKVEARSSHGYGPTVYWRRRPDSYWKDPPWIRRLFRIDFDRSTWKFTMYRDCMDCALFSVTASSFKTLCRWSDEHLEELLTKPRRAVSTKCKKRCQGAR